MDQDIGKAYRAVKETEDYQMNNKTRVKQIEMLYKNNKSYFGRTVLDVGCGGGILGFLIEKHVASYTGIDVNPDQVKAAREYAKKVGSKCKFILGDAEKIEVPEKYDTITIIGNGLPNISTEKLCGILDNLQHNVKEAIVIIEYVDMVSAIFHGVSMPSDTKGLSVKEIGFDGVKGNIIRRVSTASGAGMEFGYHIWSPYILQFLLNTKRIRLLKRGSGYFEYKGWHVPSLLEVYRWQPNLL